MGKRIPSKKHNKLKSVDPFNRGANSNAFKKQDDETKNLAPKKLTQETPSSVKRLFAFDEADEDHQQQRKKRKKSSRITVRTLDHRNDTEALVSQNTYETDQQFLKRVSQMANRARERADISAKFDVRFHEDGTFEHEVSELNKAPTRMKRRLQELKEKKKVKKLAKLSKSHKKEAEGQPKEFPGVERLQFGETVHAPPEITAKLRGAPERDARKTAKSLLCNPANATRVAVGDPNPDEVAVAEGANSRTGKSEKSVKSEAGPKTPDAITKVRWKKLGPTKRAELEAERQRVIAAYRKLKNKT